MKNLKEGYYINVEGEKIIIEFSKHAKQRCQEREVNEYEIYSLILKVGEDLLDLKNGEQFAIVDKEQRIGIVNQIYCDNYKIYIEVVTVLSSDNVYITRGTKTINVSNLKEI